eukprot:GEMP01049198.1.p1 GENE.GEMP01049198.1~~GEMP01049198.1.p1  ORF type:complete len:443 (+),score=81.37 GEMP01049198.1:26-1354(+)
MAVIEKTEGTEDKTSPESPTPKTFEEIGVCRELCSAVAAMGWKVPTEIQLQAIPHALQGRDLIALAKTGSGKTGAFAIPVVQTLLENPQTVYALVLAPTRELSHQIGEHFQALGAQISLSVAVIVGGMNMVNQALELAKKPHVIVATPGRIVDHLENTKGFHIKSIKYLIMDEADRLLSLDFDVALDKILNCVPKQRHTYLFSATMTSKVSKLERASLRNPAKVEVSTKYQTNVTLVQNYNFVAWKYKMTHLCAMVNHYKHYSMMIFVDTCVATQKIAMVLRRLNFEAIALHGKMYQNERIGSLNHFRAGEKKILVATDVASRGLDIPQVDIVVNYDIPQNSKDYIHRVGRTARAGRSGRSITMITQYDIEAFQRVEHFLGKKLEEFTEIREEEALTLHERVLEASREADMEIKEKENDGVRPPGVKKKLKVGTKKSKRPQK